MKNKNQTKFEDSDDETSTQQSNGKNGTTNANNQQTGDFKNFDLSKKTVKKLKARNVEYLYPVQSKSYKSIYEQNDCLIQASTGSGKTLAYVLPLVEFLQSDKTFELADGRSARVLVLSSTKDTVKQVSDEFQSIVNDLSVVGVYSAKKKSDEQETAIANGVDVLVATPDRLKELVDNEKVDLSSVNHVVIDDVDQMVESEVAENIKKVLKQAFSSDRENKAQLVVLSQTSPDSYRKLIKKYLSDEAITIDLANGNTQETADDENDEGFDESANNSSKAENGSVSLLSKKENYTTYRLTTNEEIKSVGFVYAIIRKCLGDTFDAKSSIPQVAFTKDFTSAVFDLPSEFDEQIQNAWKDNNRTQLTTITQLPEIDQASITDNQGYSRGAGGNRNSGKSSGGCFKCGKEGHKSFECTEGGGAQRGGGNRAGGNGCFNCGKDGHKSFECTEPKKAGGGGGGRSNGCFNCGQDGHKSFECTEPKKAGGGGGAGGRSNGCFNCGQDGHKSFECTEPKKAGGGGGGAGGRSNACFNCGQEGHRSFECTEPKKAGGGGGQSGGCFNCGKDGHKSFECPEPKKGRPSFGGGRGGGRGGARGGGAKRSFGGGYENGNSAGGEATNKKIKFDDDDE